MKKKKSHFPFTTWRFQEQSNKIYEAQQFYLLNNRKMHFNYDERNDFKKSEVI